MKKLESTFLNMVVVLTAISLIAAGGLGAMYNATKAPIEAAQKAAQEAAIKNVLPEFARVDAADTVGENPVFRAYDAGDKLVGMAIETVAQGFGGKMKVMVGVTAEGDIFDYSLLAHAETPGLGSKASDWFKTKADIRGMNDAEGPLTVSKDGGSVDAITAATISSRAFLDAVNSALATYRAIAGNADAPEAVAEAVPAEAATADSAAVEEIEVINPESVESK